LLLATGPRSRQPRTKKYGLQAAYPFNCNVFASSD